MEKEQVGRSRDELLRFAAKRITEIVEHEPACQAVAVETMELLEQIVLDGQPSPQPASSSGDGIEVMWLVNNWFISLIVVGEDDEDDDGWILWAEDPDNHELFEAQGRPGEPIGREALRWTQHLLASMGDQIAGYDMWPVWKT